MIREGGKYRLRYFCTTLLWIRSLKWLNFHWLGTTSILPSYVIKVWQWCQGHELMWHWANSQHGWHVRRILLTYSDELFTLTAISVLANRRTIHFMSQSLPMSNLIIL